MNKCEVELIAVVLTWDGFVTNWYKKHIEKIGLDKIVQAYIQTTVLKRILESVCFDFKRSRPFSGIKKSYPFEKALDKFSEDQNKAMDDVVELEN
ncbi:hypothetical protein GVAV_000677 [Gurleya vavrai]